MRRQLHVMLNRDEWQNLSTEPLVLEFLSGEELVLGVEMGRRGGSPARSFGEPLAGTNGVLDEKLRCNWCKHLGHRPKFCPSKNKTNGTAPAPEAPTVASLKQPKKKGERRTFTADYKKQAVAAWRASGLPLRNFAAQINVHEGVLRHWRNAGKARTAKARAALATKPNKGAK